MLDWFHLNYTGWSDTWVELIENAETPFIPRPIYYMPLDQNWETLPNLTMIGDAAHVMPPFAGEGANMAMLDALELSECLTAENHLTVEEAICGFEKNMLHRASNATGESIENGEKMHSKNSLDVMLGLFRGI